MTRHRRVRAKVRGTAARPRLSVFRSNKHTHLQLIDDVAGKTLISVSTVDVAKPAQKAEKSAIAGKLLAEKALEAGVKSAVFDRGGFRYHGRVAKIAEAAREAGLHI